MRNRWTLSLAIAVSLVANGDAQQTLRASVHASGFTTPVAIVQDPSSPNIQFVVEQTGRIRVVDNGSVLTQDFLDLSGAIVSGGERGLLGMALAPDYATSGRFYVNFTNTDGNTVVARINRSAFNPLVAEPATRFDLRWNGAALPGYIEQPYSNHKGGHLVFGPDGYLYIGMGDGGGSDDPEHRAQNPTLLLGKMLRVDVNVPDTDPIGYRIPSDNPFLSGVPIAARGEIWAFGLRNPWRFNFDSPALGGTGAMIIADVGQNEWEEVDYQPPARGGRNYGWRNREGMHDDDTSLPPAYEPLVDPIAEYNHFGQSRSITGGYVYRGTALPNYRGRYFFADFISGHVYSLGLAIDASGDASVVDVIDHTEALSNTGPPGNVSSFGVDVAGELFIVAYSRGEILRIVGAGPGAPTGFRITRDN